MDDEIAAYHKLRDTVRLDVNDIDDVGNSDSDYETPVLDLKGFNGDEHEDDDEDEDTGDGAKSRGPASYSSKTVEEIFIGLSGQSIAAVSVLHYFELTRRSRALLAPILLANLVGFVSCTAAILQRQRRPRFSRISGIIGSAAVALGIVLMIAMIIPLTLLWLIAAACLGLLAIFILTFMYKNNCVCLGEKPFFFL